MFSGCGRERGSVTIGELQNEYFRRLYFSNEMRRNLRKL